MKAGSGSRQRVAHGAAGPALSRFVARRAALVFAALLGVVSVGGYAPFYFFPLPIAALALLIVCWQHTASVRRAALLGWWFGVGFFTAGVSWVYVSLHDFGAMPAPLAAFCTMLFCAYLALFPAIAGYVCTRLPSRRPWAFTLALATAWTLLEWIRGWLFTGFPWLALGYSQVPGSPLAGYAPVLGIGGVTLITAASAALLAMLSPRADEKGRWSRCFREPALYVLITLWLGGYVLQQVPWTHPVGEPLEVSLLQGNVPQELKWREDRLRTTLETYRVLTLESRSRLIVLPETALPLFLNDVPAFYLDELEEHARQNRGDILVGVPEGVRRDEYYNSAISLGTAPRQVYRKVHLVPFGEFIPLRPVLGWIVSVLAIPLQDFSRGAPEQQPLAIAGQRVAVDICYEDAFGEEIIRQLPQATLLANLSNVAWFGRSIAPYQHLQISQARALETGRYMLRATNTGMTAIVSPQGRLEEVAPEFTLFMLTRSVQGYAGATPYVRWGNAPVLGLSVVLVLAGFALGRRHP
jgi:apolipoprotein N-acyltransferase